MSTHALVYLAELLEYKKVLLADMTPRRLHQIQAVQEKITSEVARRATSIHSSNFKVRRMLVVALAKLTAEHGAECYPLMPTMMFR